MGIFSGTGYKEGFKPEPDAWEGYHAPAWVVARQNNAIRPLQFEPPKPTKREKALPLTLGVIANALAETFGGISEAYELDSLDVWYIKTEPAFEGQTIGYDIVLYEHMGEWKCSSITKRRNTL